MKEVAALYVDPKGPYPKIAGVDCWDAERDARLYTGSSPVVAHPPCGPWGKLRHMYQGNDRDCALIAVEQVRRLGGVLEHPAGSKLWAECGLANDGIGSSYEVCQVDWGHVARKRTWLYCVRVDERLLDQTPPFADKEPTHWVSGTHGNGRGKTPPGIKVCSRQQRNRTPPLFAQWLVDLARSVYHRRSMVVSVE